jgi:hypothetical protein
MVRHHILCISRIVCLDVQAGSSESSLNCEKYANDSEILSQFPISVPINSTQYVPGQNTALLDPTGSLVIMMEIKQIDITVPESVFCLKNLQSWSLKI